MAGAVLCVLRARFFRFEVRRLGTAIGLSCGAFEGQAGVGVSPRPECYVVLLRGLLELAERVPTRVGLVARALVGTSIEIGATVCTQAFAVLTTQSERRRREQPLLAQDRSQIDLCLARVELIDIGIVGFLASTFGEDDVGFVAHVCGGVGKTPAALERHVAFDAAVPVEAARTGGRQATSHARGLHRLGVTRFPHWIIGGKLLVDDDSM